MIMQQYVYRSLLEDPGDFLKIYITHHLYTLLVSVAVVWTDILANLSNKIAKFTGNFEDVDESQTRGVVCQH